MIDVRQGGPGEVEIEIERELDKIAWGEGVVENEDQTSLTLWLDPSRALDLANKLMDIVQAMDDAEREEGNDEILAQQELEDFEDADDRMPGASEIL